MKKKANMWETLNQKENMEKNKYEENLEPKREYEKSKHEKNPEPEENQQKMHKKNKKWLNKVEMFCQ